MTMDSLPTDFVARARAIILSALGDLAPAQAKVVVGYIEPLVEQLLRNEPLELDRSEEAGRFGSGDWTMTFLVVSVVVAALQRQEKGLDATITRDEVRACARRLGTWSSRAVADRIVTASAAALAGRSDRN